MPLHHSENIDVEIQTEVITCSFRDIPLIKEDLYLCMGRSLKTRPQWGFFIFGSLFQSATRAVKTFSFRSLFLVDLDWLVLKARKKTGYFEKWSNKVVINEREPIKIYIK